jgi:uncharacterized membrane protein HdeD (DUF308 family)
MAGCTRCESRPAPAGGLRSLANPDIGLTTLALLVGIGLLVRGTLEIVVGFTLRGTRGATP